MMNLLLVGLGGAAGSMLRYGHQLWLNGHPFPYGTFLVNICGCFLIGLLAGVSFRNSLSTSYNALLITGFCGGFTTFSAFSIENWELIKQNRWVLFSLYTSGTLLLGLMATFAGYKITTSL
jgi:CrcB protein